MDAHSELIHSISDRRRIAEILAVLFTGIGKFIFMDLLNWKLVFITAAIAGWAFYIAFRHYQSKEILRYWGFRTDNLKTVALRVLPFGVLSVMTFFVVGYLQGTLNLSWHVLPVLIIYPIWGTIQQFLLIGLVAGNCQDFTGFSIPEAVILPASALLFAGVHYPDHWLILATFLLALFYGYIYLKARNVYILGLFHGWLGGLFYYTVVNRDPFTEVFGKLL
jgi:hypothetical protein